jgi:hypothetical protein
VPVNPLNEIRHRLPQGLHRPGRADEREAGTLLARASRL